MKVFFGTNLTLDKNNDRMDGEDFGVERLPESQETALDESASHLDALQSRAQFPSFLRAIRTACGLIAIVLGVSILRALTEIPLKNAYANAPVLFWLVPLTAAVWGTLTYLGIQRKKAVESGEEAKNALKAADALMRSCYDTLGVPKHADEMDVLCSQYCVKDGQIVNKPTACYTFVNAELKVFVQDDALCFADISQKICVPLSSLQSIRRIEKSITFPTWNKETSFKDAPYDQYKISATRFGYSIKSYYALCIRGEGGEDYELYFPAYELPTVQKLTGLIPTE
jgi:hypothetical protein